MKNGAANQEHGILVSRVVKEELPPGPVIPFLLYAQAYQIDNCANTGSNMFLPTLKVNTVCCVHRLLSRETSWDTHVDLRHEKEALAMSVLFSGSDWI